MNCKNNNTIVNLSNSILKHYTGISFHNTIPEIDNLLKSHKKVLVCLFDGLGSYIRETYKDVCPFIYNHKVHSIVSTFPPTTVAATTGFATAKFPVESGWMSWTQYFDEYKCNIDVFRNKKTDTDIVFGDKNDLILDRICPRKPIFDIINESKGHQVAYDLGKMGRDEKGRLSLFNHRRKITKLLRNNDEAYVYYYRQNPDHEIHVEGVKSKVVEKEIKKLQKFTKKIVKKNPDTLVLIIADHGLIDCKYIDIASFPDLLATLVEDKPISMEKRCPTFFVKPEEKENFALLFNKYFGEHFELLTKEQVLEQHIFGEGEKGQYFDMFIGDYLAIAKDEYSLSDSREENAFFAKGRHAGGTDEEMNIDISAYNI